MFGATGHHRFVRVLWIILERHGTAFERILLCEGHNESMTVGLPSQRVAFAEINILWTCPINRHYLHGLLPAHKTVLTLPMPKIFMATSARRKAQRKRQNVRNR